MMPKSTIPFIFTVMVALLTIQVTAAKPDKGFIKIFDGKTLDGWEAMPAKTAFAWSVEDGMIVGNGAKARSYIVYQNKEVADLELKFAYRFPGKGNSGVSIRAIVDPTGKRGRTLSAMVHVLAEGTTHITSGCACENEFHPVAL